MRIRLRHFPARVLARLSAFAWPGALVIGLASVSAQADELQISTAAERPYTKRSAFERPDLIPFPPTNPYSVAKAELGKLLFFDPRISGNNQMSCATCHNPSFGWEDGLPKGRGQSGNVLGRHTPTVINLAWTPLLFWDGRAVELEGQAAGPIVSDAEMAQPIDTLLVELGDIPDYRKRFDTVFPDGGLTADNIAKAIAAYERTLVSGEAPFDRWIAGNEGAVSESAKRGFALFVGDANCVECHRGWNFTDSGFHDIGIPDEDLGRGGKLTGIPVLQHAFKTPGLRNITRRAPYMHDGSLPTLEAVVDHYDSGFVTRGSLSPAIEPLNLTEGEKSDIVEFMKTLDDDGFDIIAPVLPTRHGIGRSDAKFAGCASCEKGNGAAD